MLFGKDIVYDAFGHRVPRELIEVQSEIKALYKHIRAVNSDLLKLHNLKPSTLVCRICENQETVFLEQILEFAYQTGVCDRSKPIASLQHDGLMLEKQPNLTEKWLRDLEEFIWDTTGFQMHYRFKSMNVKTPYN